MRKTVVIVDDEPDILELVSLHLKKSGFETKGFLEPESFLNFVQSRKPDLIVLDLMLPHTDGFDICKKLRTDEKLSDVPIIMLTARGEDTDKILGLELGADDYVTKPFSPKELVARVKAVLRRSEKGEKSRDDVVHIGGFMVIDPGKYQVRVDDSKVELTSTEFKILMLLASGRGRVFSREQILDHLWGSEKAVVDRTIDVHIKNLRDKLGRAGSLIKNMRGVGYKIEE
ncbi:MAG: response regulator transcription factor [Candidatus Aureabacteria bacterium]|nr:response regulator transcription factor [Candidatus Auribacterota bacterium]